MKDYPVEVRLLAATLPVETEKVKSAEDLLEYAGRLCTNSVEHQGKNPEFLQARIKEGHESLIEHASVED